MGLFKKILIVFIMILSVFTFFSCDDSIDKTYLRLHIRANSNSANDQEVKYFIKDELIEYLTPVISKVNSKSDFEKYVLCNEIEIEKFIDNLLSLKGFDYKSNIKINNEYFPTRNYGDLTLSADYYDALIVELGDAIGDNWWCVVYPPLCFVNNGKTNSIVYKSKLVEIIKKYF